MEGEIVNFCRVWIVVVFSLTYSYLISRTFQKGLTRFFLLLPIVCLFLFLPLSLTSIHLGGSFSFFIAWLANFKLLLLAFGKGPLSSDRSSSLGRFLAVGCLPIRIANRVHQSHYPSSPKFNLLAKGLLLGILICVFEFFSNLDPNLVLFLYCFYIYFLLEILLAIVTAMVRALNMGVELEPYFNEPYLSTSLQDFWGKRWNLVVSDILRPTVYEPCRRWSSALMNRRLAPLPAVVATFAVSGLMHELIYFYFGRVWPTWEVTCFFIFNGLSLTVEMMLKEAFAGKFHLPGLISGILTIGFVMITSFRLFFPQFLRCRSDARMFEEYAAVGAFLKNVALWPIRDSTPNDL